tara:strand:- start:485 stop:1279 length:795 start_codon:yes stop_codon:yes gene_type:complete
MKKSELHKIVREVIRKVGDEYAVYPKKGGSRLGTHKTRKGAQDQMTAIHISKYSENLDPSYKHDGKAAPYGSGYRPAKKEAVDNKDPLPLKPEELKTYLASIDGWSIKRDKLYKRYKFETFSEALNFINNIAPMLDKEDHHPILFNFYSVVDLYFYSGFADNKITSLDFEVAKKVDEIHEESTLNELKCKYGQYFCPHDKVYKCRKSPKKTRSEDVHKPMNPGILKKRLGKLSCSKVRAERAKLKDKGTTYAKALQRYLNYHCQ